MSLSIASPRSLGVAVQSDPDEAGHQILTCLLVTIAAWRTIERSVCLLRLAISGFPFVTGPTELWNVSVFFEECLLEVWDTNGADTDWAVIISWPRPDGLERDDGKDSTTQDVGSTTRNFCERSFPFGCPDTETYLLLVDIAFSWKASGAVLPADQPQVIPGILSARQTLMAIPVVDIFPVDSSRIAGQVRVRKTQQQGNFATTSIDSNNSMFMISVAKGKKAV